MQLNLAGLVLAALAIGNRRVQVANLISFEAVSFEPGADGRRWLLWDKLELFSRQFQRTHGKSSPS